METVLGMGALPVSGTGVQEMKESFNEIINRISKDEFRATLEQLDKEETCKKFNLSLLNFSQLVRLYEAQDIIEKIKQQKRKLAYQQKAKEKLQTLISNISKLDLIDFYITKNNSFSETAAHFNISESSLLQLIKFYDCKKPKAISNVLSEQTKETRYGSTTYNNREQAVKTCLDKYGVENPAQVSSFMNSAYDTKCIRYGHTNPNNWIQGHQTRIQNSGSIEESYKITSKHRKQSCIETYGVDNTAKLESVKNKIKLSLKETFQERYGVDCYWLTEDAIRSTGSKHSSFNESFASLLDRNEIMYVRETRVGNFIYDFQVDNYLIEINPTPTHNVTWSPFSSQGIDRDYHERKTLCAEQHGYRCIHIWDWDDKQKVIDLLLKQRLKLFARKCVIKNVSYKAAKEFTETYHLQGYAKDSIRLGLYYLDKLVSLMTFGKPRYSQKFEYELIRYCSSCNIIGGAEKLFNYFIEHYKPQSIVSYCDRSKFQGNVYTRLGFVYKNTTPSSHWYHLQSHKHILESLLMSRGFDQLFGTSYGKGTSNKQLMIDHNFLEVVDAGQSVFTWNKKV